MSRLIQWIDETFYPGILGNWDDALFRERILSVIQAEAEILDLGAGAGIVPHMNFLGRGRRVCSVDPVRALPTIPTWTMRALEPARLSPILIAASILFSPTMSQNIWSIPFGFSGKSPAC